MRLDKYLKVSRLGGGLLECSEDFVVLDSDGYCVIEK